MPVSAQTPLVNYTASGSGTVFAYPFRILDEADLEVYVGGVQQTTGFEVTGVGDGVGGDITFTEPPLAGALIKLQRNVERVRTTDYVEGGALRAQTLDDDLDRIVMMLQDVEAQQNEINPTYAAEFIEQEFTATASQTLFTLTDGVNYTQGSNDLEVFVNGAKQIPGVDYTETNPVSLTFATGLNVSDVVVLRVTDLRALATGALIGTGLDIDGRVLFDTTSDTASYPAAFTHSNLFTNATPFGRGTVLIQASAQNNNQPLLLTQKTVNDASFGNSANLILQNLGGSITTSSAFAADLEIVANNSLYSAYNGKFELGVVSGRDTGDTRKRDGLFYIAPRRGPLHPSGENTGFEQTFIFLPLTAAGQGIFETLGNGGTFTPAYDFGTFSKIEMTNGFQNSIWTNTASASGKSARIENYGDAASWLLTKTTTGQSSVYVRADTGAALLQLQASLTSGTSSPSIELWSGTKYWRNSHSGTTNNLSFQYNDGVTTVTNAEFSVASDGLFSVYRQSNAQKGRIRLGSGAGAAGGGIVEYDSATGAYTLSGTGASLTVGGVLYGAGGAAGTVTSVSVASANGFAGTVATATTTPAITLTTSVTGLLKGNGTAISAAVAGTDYLTTAVTSLAGTTNQITASASTGAVTLNFPTLVSLSGTNAMSGGTAGSIASAFQLVDNSFPAIGLNAFFNGTNWVASRATTHGFLIRSANDGSLSFFSHGNAAAAGGTVTNSAMTVMRTSATASTSSITGTFTVTGGVGISGSVFIGANLNVSGATSVIGYATGSGGAVTQITSRTTSVTLNKGAGAITLFTAAGSATATTFTVTNSTVAVTDTVQVSVRSGTNVYLAFVSTVAAGSFNITFYTTGGVASDTPIFNFAVIKAVAA
jgi:hypothetical protein